MTYLKFMAVSVETCCGEFVNWKAATSYLKGSQVMDPANHIQRVISAGTSSSATPAWNDGGGTTADGTVTWQDTGNVVLSQAERIAYISNAVSYINTNYPNLKVAIYTSGGPQQAWQTITGNCGATGTNPCPSLIALPLWDAEHKTSTGGDGAIHCGDGVAGLLPWKPWSATTWQTRSGNQYDRGLQSSAPLALERNSDPEAIGSAKCASKSFFGLKGVSLDYFSPSLF